MDAERVEQVLRKVFSGRPDGIAAVYLFGTAAASLIISLHRLEEPATNRQMFDVLAPSGWRAGDVCAPLRRMAGFQSSR